MHQVRGSWYVLPAGYPLLVLFSAGGANVVIECVGAGAGRLCNDAGALTVIILDHLGMILKVERVTRKWTQQKFETVLGACGSIV